MATLTSTIMYRAIPTSEWAHPNVFETRGAAERYLAGYVDGGRVEQIEVNNSPLKEARVERSYSSDRKVLLLTQLALEELIADCTSWPEIEAALAEAAQQAGADHVGALTESLCTDGVRHAHRWLDGCTLQPASKKIKGLWYAAFTVATRSGYRVAAVKHCQIG